MIPSPLAASVTADSLVAAVGELQVGLLSGITASAFETSTTDLLPRFRRHQDYRFLIDGEGRMEAARLLLTERRHWAEGLASLETIGRELWHLEEVPIKLTGPTATKILHRLLIGRGWRYNMETRTYLPPVVRNRPL